MSRSTYRGKPSAYFEKRERIDPLTQQKGGWDPWSAIPNYYDLPKQTKLVNGQWVFGKDAWGKPYRVDTGGWRKNGQPIFTTEIPDYRRKAQKAYLKRVTDRKQAKLDALAAKRKKLQEKAKKDLAAMRAKQLEVQDEQAQLLKNTKTKYQEMMEEARKAANRESRRVEASINRNKKLETKSKQAALRLGKKAEQSRARAAAAAEEARKVKEQSAIDVRNMNITSGAVASSLKILAKGPTSPGPSAKQSQRTPRAKGAKTTTTGLRIGSQPSRSGANLAI